MTSKLPSSGPITLGDVAQNIEAGTPIQLGQSTVRALAGRKSGQSIELGQLRDANELESFIKAGTDGTSIGFFAANWGEIDKNTYLDKTIIGAYDGQPNDRFVFALSGDLQATPNTFRSLVVNGRVYWRDEATVEYNAGTNVTAWVWQNAHAGLVNGQVYELSINTGPDVAGAPQPAPQATPHGLTGEYTLTFEDTFSGSSLDLTKWNRSLWYETPAEDQGAAPNYAVANGKLSIWPESSWTRRVLTTHDKFSPKYGYFEIRAKLPKGKGLIPALWMLHHSTNDRPGIDILKAYPGGTAVTTTTTSNTSIEIEYHGDQMVYILGQTPIGSESTTSANPTQVAAFDAALASQYVAVNKSVYWSSAVKLRNGTGGVTALDTQLSTSTAQIVILQVGFADKYEGRTVAQIKDDYRALVDIVRNRNKYCIIETGNETNDSSWHAHLQAIREVATEKGVHLIDQFTYTQNERLAGGLSIYDLCPDGKWPNQTWHTKKGQYAAQRLAEIQAADPACPRPSTTTSTVGGGGNWGTSDFRPVDFELAAYDNGAATIAKRRASTALTVPDLNADFHYYGVLWDESGVQPYFDGSPVGAKIATSALQSHPMYLLLSLAYETDAVLAPNTTDTPTGNTNAFEIEHVRAWSIGRAATTTPPTGDPTGTPNNPGSSPPPTTPGSNGTAYVAPVGHTKDKYPKLSFRDEFNTDALDTARWNTNPPGGTASLGTANIRVANGSLYLWPAQPFPTQLAQVNSHTKFSQRYGYVEVRARLPKGRGLEPAFFLANRDLTGVTPEIDLMTTFCGADASRGNDYANSALQPVRFDANAFAKNNALIATRNSRTSVGYQDLTEWHTYGLHWDENTLQFYFDGKPVGTPVNFTASNRLDQAMYVTLAMYAGLTQTGGTPNATETPTGDTNALVIDYIRCWELANGGTQVFTTVSKPAEVPNQNDIVQPQRSRYTTGYYLSNLGNLIDVANFYTHLDLAYGNPAFSWNGLSANNWTGTGLSFTDLPQTIKTRIGALQAKGVRVLLAIGGSGYTASTGWDALAASANATTATKTAIKNFIADMGLDGIALDYRVTGTSTAVTDQYRNVVQALREAVSESGSSKVLEVSTDPVGGDCTSATTAQTYCTGRSSVHTTGNAGRERLTFVQTVPSGTFSGRTVGDIIDIVTIRSFDMGVANYDPVTAYLNYRSLVPATTVVSIGLQIAPEASGSAVLVPAIADASCSGATITADQYGAASPGSYSVERFINFLDAQTNNASDGFMVWHVLKTTSATCGGKPAASTVTIGQLINGTSGSPTTTVPPSGAANVVEFYGNSTLWGLRPGGGRSTNPPPEAFAALRPEYEVRNLAINSTTTQNWLDGSNGVSKPWTTLMAESTGRYVVLGHGVLDIFERNAAAFKQNLKQLITIAKNYGKRPVVMTPAIADYASLADYAVAAREAAAEAAVPLLDVFAHTKSVVDNGSRRIRDYVPDGIHPNDALYLSMGNYMAEQWPQVVGIVDSAPPPPGASQPGTPPPAGLHLYVSPSGHDTAGNGTASSPFRTIGRADQVAVPGTTIHVAAGTYNGPVITSKSGTAANPIRFVSTTKHGAKIVNPSGDNTQSIWIVDGSYQTIDGFEIDGQNTDTSYIGIYVRNGNFARILNNKVHRIGRGAAPASSGAGILADNFFNTVADAEIRGNLVHHIGPVSHANSGFWHGLYPSSARARVYNNLVHNVSGWAIHFWHDATHGHAINNTLFACGTGGIVFGSGDYYNQTFAGNNYIIANNIVYQNGNYGIHEEYGPEYGNGHSNVVANNLVIGHAIAEYNLLTTSAASSISGQPGFVNYQSDGSGDYRLQGTSVAINAGRSADAPNTDYLGNMRPYPTGGLVDAGAYEYQSLPPSTSPTSSTRSLRDTATPTGRVTPRVPSGHPHRYELTFEEEFNGSSLNRSVWNTHIWYAPEHDQQPVNYEVADGALNIWPNAQADWRYRTIDTDGKFYQTYGFFEIEAKLPRGKGPWPAFWLLNHDGTPSDPSLRPEIDIMEAWPGGGVADGWGTASLEPDNYGCALHRKNGSTIAMRKLSDFIGRTNLYDSWHTYGCLWEPDGITFFFDGQAVGGKIATDFYQYRMYILLQVWIGGTAGNQPDGSVETGKPNSYSVRYVRAWRKL